jgi:hypothetical protein
MPANTPEPPDSEAAEAAETPEILESAQFNPQHLAVLHQHSALRAPLEAAKEGVLKELEAMFKQIPGCRLGAPGLSFNGNDGFFVYASVHDVEDGDNKPTKAIQAMFPGCSLTPGYAFSYRLTPPLDSETPEDPATADVQAIFDRYDGLEDHEASKRRQEAVMTSKVAALGLEVEDCFLEGLNDLTDDPRFIVECTGETADAAKAAIKSEFPSADVISISPKKIRCAISFERPLSKVVPEAEKERLQAEAEGELQKFKDKLIAKGLKVEAYIDFSLAKGLHIKGECSGPMSEFGAFNMLRDCSWWSLKDDGFTAYFQLPLTLHSAAVAGFVKEIIELENP